MFVDKVQITVIAGDGGDGCLSFRHEKYVDKGGPDGGDGGRGGDVIFVASRNQNTLVNFRYQKELKAEPGKAGYKQRKHGKNGLDLLVQVPVGTVVISDDGVTLADLTFDGQQAIIARGGDGGFGNAHFVSSTRQAPRVAEKGEQGQMLTVDLELKMIADVGLVGLPNAGKSTLLASISNARPEIANYPFTTLRPNLGVVAVDETTSLLFADIPGLIEGASQGKGLGDDFLRHIERTRVLVHLVDSYSEDIVGDYQTVQQELAAYKIDLSKRPHIIVLTKIEGLDDEIVADGVASLRTVVGDDAPILAVSAHSKQGIRELLYAVEKLVNVSKREEEAEQVATDGSVPVLRVADTQASWTVTAGESGFVVRGRKIEKFAARTDFDNYHAIQRIRDIMRKMGIMHELERRGIEPGMRVQIGATHDQAFFY